MKFITVDGEKVQFIHYMPFDEKDGLGKTEEELKQIGYLVDDIPEPVPQEGKIAKLHYTEEKGFWYEYVDIPNENMVPKEVYNNIVQQVKAELLSELANKTEQNIN